MTWKNDSHWSHLVEDGPSEKITGKYLFFSTDRDRLIAIAEFECKMHGFFRAKISLKASGADYVLCLYWIDDSRRRELVARYGNMDGVKYRYWKSDAATRRGEYSQEHLRGKP